MILFINRFLQRQAIDKVSMPGIDVMERDPVNCVLEWKKMSVSLCAVPALRHDVCCSQLLAVVAEIVVSLLTKLLTQS